MPGSSSPAPRLPLSPDYPSLSAAVYRPAVSASITSPPRDKCSQLSLMILMSVFTSASIRHVNASHYK